MITSQQWGYAFFGTQPPLRTFYFYRKKEPTIKKTISLLLAFVLCLSLCACGGGSEVPNETGTPAESTTESTANIEDATEATESELVNHPLYTKLFGTWENQNKDDEYAPYQTLIINEDGSCSIDGTVATWEWDGSKTTSTLVVNILVDGERVCGAILFADGTITGQTSNHGIGGYYFNTSNSEQ